MSDVRCLFVCLLLTLAPYQAQAQQAQPQDSRSLGDQNQQQPDPRRLLLPTPAEEDWSFLADPKARTETIDQLKYIPLSKPGSYLSVGGEARLFMESFRNQNFGQIRGADTYPEARLLLHADYHPSANFRFYLSTQSAFIGDRTDGPRPFVDRDQLDILEGFAEYHSTAFNDTLKGPAVTARIGRQQLDFGAGRLLSSREGPLGQGANVLQGFDGVRTIFRQNDWRLDGFATKPVGSRPGVLNDGWLKDQGAWGVYASRSGPPGSPIPGTDFYYIGTTRPDAVFSSGIADETRHSVGTRAFQQGTPFSYDLEAIYQFGDFGNRSISAWALTGEASYTFEKMTWSPQPGIRVGADSGGGKSGELRTFYVPFPRGAYFGNLSAIGPENTLGVEGVLAMHPTRTLTLKAGAYFFWRTSLNDGVYGLPGFPLAPPINRGRYIGYQPIFQASWEANPHLTINAAYETFQRGDFLKTPATNHSVDYFAAWATYRF